MNQKFKKLMVFDYAKLYLVLSLVIGVAFLGFYPNFQAPHEKQHFLHGLTYSPLYIDGTLPKSIFRFVRENGKHNGQATDISLNLSERRAFKSHSNVSIYPAVNYVPQTIAGAFGYIFEASPQKIYYMARGLCLLLGVVLGYITLRLLPACHLPMMVALLLPSIWIMRTSQYTDHVVTSLSFLFFALLTHILYRKHTINIKYTLVFLGLGAALSASKILYFPIVLSILLIPKGQYKSLWHRVGFIGIIISISLAYSVFFGTQALGKEYGLTTQHITSPQQENEIVKSNGRFGAKQQAVYNVLYNPEDVWGKISNTYSSADFWHRMLLRVYIWSGDVKGKHTKPEGVLAPIPSWLLLLALFPFLIVPSGTRSTPANEPTENQPYSPSILGRVLLAGIIASIILLLALAMYTGWTQNLHRSILGGIQGRYFVPLLPYMALMISFPAPSRFTQYIQLGQVLIATVVLLWVYLRLFAVY